MNRIAVLSVSLSLPSSDIDWREFGIIEWRVK